MSPEVMVTSGKLRTNRSCEESRTPSPSSPSPPPTSSSSSSSDDSPPRRTFAPTTMPTEASVESNSNKLPTLTPGIVTPLVANEFFFACTNYFRVKKVKPDVQTAMTFSCFRDQRIVNWLSTPANATRLGDMPFSAFQLEFKRKFLRADWE
ncbi:hypothetical protein B0H11DRAFT_2254106 [Mycena galericulata]|nr:hypothetical protein B0H11DRAFT_2254106 [Mycena galericulata]